MNLRIGVRRRSHYALGGWVCQVLWRVWACFRAGGGLTVVWGWGSAWSGRRWSWHKRGARAGPPCRKSSPPSNLVVPFALVPPGLGPMPDDAPPPLPTIFVIVPGKRPLLPPVVAPSDVEGSPAVPVVSTAVVLGRPARGPMPDRSPRTVRSQVGSLSRNLDRSAPSPQIRSRSGGRAMCPEGWAPTLCCRTSDSGTGCSPSIHSSPSNRLGSRM